jgi:hypothetical protein
MTAVSASEEVARDYWGAQGRICSVRIGEMAADAACIAPIRTLFFSVLTGYTYIFKQGRGNVSATSNHPIINSLIFTWAFMEAIWWFWVS